MMPRTLVLAAAFLVGAQLATVAHAQTQTAAQCNIAYTAAYMSMFNGDCKRDADASHPPGSCSQRCQGKIDAMKTACQGQHFIEEDDTIVPFANRSFLVRAVNTLERLGPADCDYTAFYSRCDPHCSLAYITGGQGTSDFEAHHCLDVDPESPQSSPEAVFHRCAPASHTCAPYHPTPSRAASVICHEFGARLCERL
jgi:hypothetical protein